MLQVAVKLYGDDKDPEIRAKACELVTRIAKEYARDEVPKAKLYEVRDRYLAEMGLKVRGGRKRPAAAAEGGAHNATDSEGSAAKVLKRPSCAIEGAWQEEQRSAGVGKGDIEHEGCDEEEGFKEPMFFLEGLNFGMR